MRIRFNYGLVGDEETSRSASTWVGDLLKAERKYGKPAEQLMTTGELEPLAFVLHTRLAFIARRGEDPNLVAVPGWEQFRDGEEVGTLAWLDVVDVVANPTAAAKDS